MFISKMFDSYCIMCFCKQQLPKRKSSPEFKAWNMNLVCRQMLAVTLIFCLQAHRITLLRVTLMFFGTGECNKTENFEYLYRPVIGCLQTRICLMVQSSHLIPSKQSMSGRDLIGEKNVRATVRKMGLQIWRW